jgi:glutamate-ammonia-ligase adenylyltransferase
MALTRARVVVGGAAARAKAEAAIGATLRQPRDPATLRAQVAEMRADIARAKPAKGSFDVKLAPGGLVDLEFAVHFVQLRDRIGLVPELPVAIAMLGPALPDGLAAANDLLTRFLVMLRLVAPGTSVPTAFVPAVEAMMVAGTGATNFAGLVAQLGLAKTAVRLAFTSLVSSKGNET